jgi:hypothetical protein
MSTQEAIEQPLSQEEIAEQKAIKAYNKDLKYALQRLTIFLEPIETSFTGMGLPSLFGWLVVRTGTGIIITSPMGAGKTLMVKIIEVLTQLTNGADHILNVQEFKKTDWKEYLPAHAVEEHFLFLIPEISAMPKYSQELFWDRIPALQSDGNFEYRYPSTDKEEGGSIVFENCSAAYAIASQPPKTHALINDTTFRTLANDRCWNIILINQLRGEVNVPISKVNDVLKKIDILEGDYTNLLIKTTTSRFKRFKGLALPKTSRKRIYKGEEITEKYWMLSEAFVKFENGQSNHVKQAFHISQSTLNLEAFEDCIRNQYSVNRRTEQMNNLLKQWGLFLNIPTIKQVHVDLFVSLFGFYVNLFNSLTTGTVEQSIDIKYGAVEMLCRVSDLIARNRLVTQTLLTKEFNAEDPDVSFHVNSLVEAKILKGTKPLVKKRVKRAQSSKNPRTVRRQTNVLTSVGLLTKRVATKDDSTNNQKILPREAIYDFTEIINGHFVIYASILDDLLPKAVRKQIPQLQKFLKMNNHPTLENF